MQSDDLNFFLRQVDVLPVGTDIVYTFWVGMHFLTQVHILNLCANCKSVQILIVFRDRKWRRPDDILKRLAAFGDGKWTLYRTIITSMHGSCEIKTAWLFNRD
jgi:hypothetical protein